MGINIHICMIYLKKCMFLNIQSTLRDFTQIIPPVGGGLKGSPDGSASKAWNYAGLLYNLYRDVGPKHCHPSHTSSAQSLYSIHFTQCNMLLTGLHHFPVVSITFLLLSSSSILPIHLPSILPSLMCKRVKMKSSSSS